MIGHLKFAWPALDDPSLRESGMSEPYLIMKRGLYYKPNGNGYTGIRDHAGRYSQDEAQSHEVSSWGCTPVIAVKLSEATEFAPACYHDLALRHVIAQRDAMRAVLMSIAVGAIQNEGLRLASPDHGDDECVYFQMRIGDMRTAVRLTNGDCLNSNRIACAGPKTETA